MLQEKCQRAMRQWATTHGQQVDRQSSRRFGQSPALEGPLQEKLQSSMRAFRRQLDRTHGLGPTNPPAAEQELGSPPCPSPPDRNLASAPQSPVASASAFSRSPGLRCVTPRSPISCAGARPSTASPRSPYLQRPSSSASSTSKNEVGEDSLDCRSTDSCPRPRTSHSAGGGSPSSTVQSIHSENDARRRRHSDGEVDDRSQLLRTVVLPSLKSESLRKEVERKRRLMREPHHQDLRTTQALMCHESWKLDQKLALTLRQCCDTSPSGQALGHVPRSHRHSAFSSLPDLRHEDALTTSQNWGWGIDKVELRRSPHGLRNALPDHWIQRSGGLITYLK